MMKPLTRRTFGSLALAPIATLAPFADAMAQGFPARPVQLIVPYAPGGSGDLITRLLGDRLSTLWGQQVVIEDRPGAGGLIAAESAAHAPPDGYTLFMANDATLTVAALHSHVPYDWKRDFAPVSMIAVGYQVLIVDPKLPVRTLADFIALAKSKKPGALNFASIGVGTAPHLAAAIFFSAAEIELTHVPYNGSSADAVRALIAGDVAMFIVGTTFAAPFIANGNVRALAVTAGRRLDSLPDVPTFAEAGLPQVDYSLWFAIAAPGATPADVVRTLNADINKIVADPGYQKALKDRGFQAKGSTPGELAAFMEKVYISNRDLIQKLGLRMD